ncbi:MAG TPA: hypothetical protein PLV92_19900 [Pirellulaceae bacterium]|nr:hypothetical protein [Pirellulaceae bacterium]
MNGVNSSSRAARCCARAGFEGGKRRRMRVGLRALCSVALVAAGCSQADQVTSRPRAVIRRSQSSDVQEQPRDASDFQQFRLDDGLRNERWLDELRLNDRWRDYPPPHPTPVYERQPYLDHMTLVAKKGDQVGEQFVRLKLSEQVAGRWQRTDAPVDSTKSTTTSSSISTKAVADSAVAEWQVELRVMPKGLLKSRFVGSSMMTAAKGETWIEFLQTKPDQVLKLHVTCQYSDHLELHVVPLFQLHPDQRPVLLTPANRRKAELLTVVGLQRANAYLHWLNAKASATKGGKGGPQTAKIAAAKKQMQQSIKLLEAARERLEHLGILLAQLEQEGKLHIRLIDSRTGKEIPLTPCEGTA